MAQSPTPSQKTMSLVFFKQTRCQTHQTHEAPRPDRPTSARPSPASASVARSTGRSSRHPRSSQSRALHGKNLGPLLGTERHGGARGRVFRVPARNAARSGRPNAKWSWVVRQREHLFRGQVHLTMATGCRIRNRPTPLVAAPPPPHCVTVGRVATCGEAHR